MAQSVGKELNRDQFSKLDSSEAPANNICYDPTLFFLPPLIRPSYPDNNPSHLSLHGYIPTIPIGPGHVLPPNHGHHYRISYRPAPLPIYPDPDSAPNTFTRQAPLIRSPRILSTS